MSQKQTDLPIALLNQISRRGKRFTSFSSFDPVWAVPAQKMDVNIVWWFFGVFPFFWLPSYPSPWARLLALNYFVTHAFTLETGNGGRTKKREHCRDSCCALMANGKKFPRFREKRSTKWINKTSCTARFMGEVGCAIKHSPQSGSPWCFYCQLAYLFKRSTHIHTGTYGKEKYQITSHRSASAVHLSHSDKEEEPLKLYHHIVVVHLLLCFILVFAQHIFHFR